MSLAEVAIAADGLGIDWSDGAAAFFHAIWLRDNCRCEHCGEPSIGRRALRLTDIDPDIAVAGARVESGNTLVIHWPDGHETRFDSRWLREHVYDDAARSNRAFVPEFWSDNTRADPPELPFADVMDSDRAFLAMLGHVRDLGICFLTGAPATAGTLETLALKVGSPQESNFGRVQNLVVDNTRRSIANDVQALKPHTDEPYRASPPGILMFHCVETDVTGAGASLFLDGFEIAGVVKREDPQGFSALSCYPQRFRRHFTDDVDLIAEFPVISTDEFDNVTGMRINDRVAAPLSITPEHVPVYYRGLRRLLQLAEDPGRVMQRTLRPGDIAVFDNHRILHGRTQLTLKGRRWLQWIQLDRGDFHSALRITADRLQISRDDSLLLRGAY